MKNFNYFPHDFDATNDMRLQKLIMKMGYEGLGFYWTIVEMLYKQGGKIELLECESIAYAMRTDSQRINTLISLVFEKDDKYFWSNSVLGRLKLLKEKSKKAKQSADKRWKNEAKNGNADAMRTHSDGNAKKERNKKKEIKEDSKKDDVQKTDLIAAFFENVPDDIVENFHKKFNASKVQIKDKAEDLFYWWRKLSPKKKKEYVDAEAILRNALKNDFGKRVQTQQFDPKEAAPDISEEERAKVRARIEAEKQKRQVKTF